MPNCPASDARPPGACVWVLCGRNENSAVNEGRRISTRASAISIPAAVTPMISFFPRSRLAMIQAMEAAPP
jgi:hypothetical protein